MNKINLFKLAWIGLGIILVIGIILVSIFFAKQFSQEEKNISQDTIPEHRGRKMPGEIIVQFPIPDLPEKEYGEEDKSINIITADTNLFESETTLSGNAIKLPDEPALPPSEKDIIILNILDGDLSLSKIVAKKGEAIILKILNEDKNCYFYIDGVGVDEEIRTNELLTISFRAPTKESELKYWIEYTEAEGVISEGQLIIN